MIVQELLGAKNSDVVTVRPSTPLVEAAQALATHRIGALVVTDDAGRLSGIISERDLIKAILLIRDTPSEEVYVLNMFRMRGSRL